MNCDENAMLAVAKIMNMDNYPLAFNKAWGFEYLHNNLKEQTLLGNRINENRSKYHIIKGLEKYCGIKYNEFCSAKQTNIIKLLEKLLMDGNYVIVNMNIYWCPWVYYYKKAHLSHLLVLIGVEPNKKFLCLDPSFSSKIEFLSYENLLRGYKSHMVPSIKYENSEKFDNLDEILHKSVSKVLKFNFIEGISFFAKEYLTNFSFSKETENMNISPLSISIIGNMIPIKGGRIAYAEFLQYISIKKQCNELNEIQRKLFESAEKWDMIKDILIKAYYKEYNNKMHRKVYNTIIEIYETEKETANLLTEYVNKLM